MKKIYSLLALGTLLLSACSGNLESTTDGGTAAPATTAAESSTASATPTNGETASGSASATASKPAATSSAASATPSPTRTVTVTTDEETSAAAPASSSSAPAENELANAVQIPLQKSQAGEGYDGYASIKTPTGNIGCSIQKDGKDGYCGVLSYMTDRKYPKGSMGTQPMYGWSISLSGDYNFEPQVKNDVPDYQVYSITAEYGQTYTYGDFACDSQENGLTCWNTTTGKGVFMNRDGYQPVTK